MENTGFVFGVPNLKTAKAIEKYPNMGVITLEAVVKKGGANRMLFNKKAIELLSIDVENEKNGVAFSFPSDVNTIVIANTSDINEKASVVVKKNETISDKKYYRTIKKRLGFDVDDESIQIKLKLANIVGKIGDKDVYTLELLTENDESTAVEDSSIVEVIEETVNKTEVAHEVSADLIEEAHVIEETVTEEVVDAPFEPTTTQSTDDFLGGSVEEETNTPFPNF